MAERACEQRPRKQIPPRSGKLIKEAEEARSGKPLRRSGAGDVTDAPERGTNAGRKCSAGEANEREAVCSQRRPVRSTSWAQAWEDRREARPYADLLALMTRPERCYQQEAGRGATARRRSGPRRNDERPRRRSKGRTRTAGRSLRWAAGPCHAWLEGFPELRRVPQARGDKQRAGRMKLGGVAGESPAEWGVEPTK